MLHLVRQEVAAALAQYEAVDRAKEIYAGQVLDTARRNLGIIRQSYTLGRGSLLDATGRVRAGRRRERRADASDGVG